MIVPLQRTSLPIGTAVPATQAESPNSRLDPFNLNPDFITYHAYWVSAITNAGVSVTTVLQSADILHIYETLLFTAIYPNGQVCGGIFLTSNRSIIN